MSTLLGRRGLLLAGASGLLVGCASGRETAPAPDPVGGSSRGAERLSYGEHPSQVVDLRRPPGDARGTVVLLHGGYWLPQYGLDQLDPMAELLTSQGWVSANVEYRRTGEGGGVPSTLQDVAAAIDLLAQHDVPESAVVALGHSAGGQLAAWAASRTALLPGGEPTVALTGAISLSGVLDLTRAAAAPGSGDPVTAFAGGSPEDRPRAYAVSDPSLLAPRCPVWAVHADGDQVVPLAQSRTYVDAVDGAGERASLVEVAGDHFSLIDVEAPSWERIEAILDVAAPPVAR